MTIHDDIESADGTALTAQSVEAVRSTWVSAAVNLLLAVAQITIGTLARSSGVVADGVHSLSDLVADFIVLLAGREGRKAADDDHPYGHHRFETGASLALGGLLIFVGVAMLGAALGKLEAPASIARVDGVALWMAGTALLAKELLFRYLLKIARRLKSSLLVANAWHARSDAASSLVVGLGVAGNLAGLPLLDPIAALIVGLLVAKMGWQFGWRSLQELMDRSADTTEVQAIRLTLEETPGVRNVHDLRTRKMGDLIIVDAHIEVDAELTVEAGHDIAVVARARVMQRHRVLDVMSHVDPYRRPDLDHGGRQAGDAAA
jgi:cation diffusion facilitator family transporter